MNMHLISEIITQVDTELIEQSLRIDFDWLNNNLSEFKVYNEPDWPSRIQLLKPFSELMLACDILMERGLYVSRCQNLIEWGWQEIEEGELLLKILSARPDLAILSGLYAHFFRFRFRNQKLEKLIAHLCNTTFIQRMELPLWRRIDLHYGLSRLGMHELNHSLLRKTWMWGLAEPWMIQDDIAYSLTHEVFYSTDFGLKPDALTDDVLCYLQLWTPVWGNIYLQRKDWDLTAEFVMVSECIGNVDWVPDPIVTLITAQSKDGYTPGPVGTASEMIKPNHPKERVLFLVNYHTTLVCLLAKALRLRHHKAR